MQTRLIFKKGSSLAVVIPASLVANIPSDNTRAGSTQKYPTSILKFAKPHPSIVKHPTQKPVALLEYLIKTYTNENELVLDNTFGSCSTGIACINTSRNFIGIEKDEKYFNIGVDRVKENITENYTLEVIDNEIK